MNTKIVIGDADSIIALLVDYDGNHKLAIDLLKLLNKKGLEIIYPNTAIAEAITTLARKHSNPQLAHSLTRQYNAGNFSVEYVQEKIMRGAVDFYDPKTSRKNTFFDALVAATAKRLGSGVIFSFDKWYSKNGFKLVTELV